MFIVNLIFSLLLLLLIKTNLVQLSSVYTTEDSASAISFLAADEHAIYKALLYEAGATAVDMRWSPIVGSAISSTSTVLLTDFDFDATRRRLVFANSDLAAHTISISECYLLRPNEDHLSCTLTTSLIYREINVTTVNVFLTLDWLNGDVYILLPGLIVRCPIPSTQSPRSTECVETKISEAINPSIVQLDPFSKSLIWNQRRSYKPGWQQYCLGINRAALTQQPAMSETECLLNDGGVTSIFINHTSGAVVFTNSSRDSIFQLNGYPNNWDVSIARKFANEGYADSVVNCPAPVRSLTHFEETDVFFWTSPDVRKRPIRLDFSQVLAFEVDGLCSSHPTTKDLSHIKILPPTPRLDGSFAKSTLTEQVRCQCTSSTNFSLKVNCRWAFIPSGQSTLAEKSTFFLVEIGSQLYYRTLEPNFTIVLTKHQLVNDLKMSDAVALHVAIRVCSKWHCALPANVYVQQSPFAPVSVQAYRAFANVLPSFSASIHWHLPNLFEASTSVTLSPDTVPDTFYHQSTPKEEVIFEQLSLSTQYVAKIETCNIWNCSETAKLSFKPDELKFEPMTLCWNNTTPVMKILSSLYPSSRRNYSRSVALTGSPGVKSAVYALPLGGRNGSIAWIDAEKWRIFVTSPMGETRLLVDSPSNSQRIRRHSLGIDLLTSRIFWLENDMITGRKTAELHSAKVTANSVNSNQQHFVYQLPNDQVWTRLSVNSTAGVVFVLSGDATAPTGALVFDLLSRRIVTNFDNEITAAVDRILTNEQNDFSPNCQPIFDENAISLYDNRVCFDLNKTGLAIKNASTPSSVSISLVNISNDFCHAKTTLRRFGLQSLNIYLIPDVAGNSFGSCIRREKSCQRRMLNAENGTATFAGLPAFTDYQLFAGLTLLLFNQSRIWHLGRIRTQPAVPTEPRHFHCSRVTPEEVYLEWEQPAAFNGPNEQVEYILKWQEPSEQDQKKLVGRTMEVEGSSPIAITHLYPDWLYEFRLVARSRLFPSTETSPPVFARCRTDSVGRFTVLPVVLERSKLGFKFHPALFQTAQNSLTAASIAYGLASELRHCSAAITSPDFKTAKWTQICSGANCTQSEPITKIINDLQPKTFYRFCLVLNYSGTGNNAATGYIYPQYSNMVVETGGFKLEPPRVWTSFAGVEVLLFAGGDPPKILATSKSSTSNNVVKSSNNKQQDKINNQIGDYQLLYSDDAMFCQNQNGNLSRNVVSRNVTSLGRSIMALRKEDFETDRRYWFRLSLAVEDQIWFSDCSDPVTARSSSETSTTALALVGQSGLVAATGLIALISCVSVVAFCLSLFAFIFLFRRINSRLSTAKVFIGRYFCRLLNYSGLSNTIRNRSGYRFEFNNFSSHQFVPGSVDHQSRSTVSGGGLMMPTAIYSTSSSGGTSIIAQQAPSTVTGAQTMTLMNVGRGHPTTGGLWSLSTLSPDTSPATATSSAGPGGIGAGGSVFSFDCDGTIPSGTGSKGTTLPLRFLTLQNQIYSTPGGLINWLHHLPANVLRLNREQITISRFLGAGAFGEVYEGDLTIVNETKQVITTPVAVKTLKPDADSDRRASFCREASLMSHFNHPNIVRLIGMCIAPSPHFAPLAGANNSLSVWPLMVLELMNGGDLLGFLRRARSATEKSLILATSTTQLHQPPNNNLSDDPNCLKMVDLFDICIDVASGCRYLEKNRFCHRDIAARNCLVSCPDEPGRRIVKIGDFGLARTLDCSAECYRKVGEGLMPVRWMAPESLNDGIFTTQSDIWSFGVLMFEVFSLGRQPYAGHANHEVFEMVKTGTHPECPRECPTAVCRLMLSCFQNLPENRPSFKVILRDLKSIRTNAVLKSRQNMIRVEKSKSSSNLTSAFTFLRPNNYNKTKHSTSVPPYATLARQKQFAKGHVYQLGSVGAKSAPNTTSLMFRPAMRSESDAIKGALRRPLSSSAMALSLALGSHKTLLPIVDDSAGASSSPDDGNKTASSANLNETVINTNNHQQVHIKVSENVTRQLLAKSNSIQQLVMKKAPSDITIVSHMHQTSTPLPQTEQEEQQQPQQQQQQQQFDDLATNIESVFIRKI